jgi:lipopolysaccharide export system permease protein
MSRIDWIVLRRVSGRVLLTIAVIFGLLALVESLDTWRFETLSRIGGPPLALLAIVAGAGRIVVNTLPVTVLIGTIIGVLDLQARRELTIIKSVGVSIWRVARAPLVAAFVLGLFAALVADTVALQINRGLPISNTHSRAGELWLEQGGADGSYRLHANFAQANGALQGVSVYFTGDDARSRIEAEAGKLASGAWVLDNAVRYSAGAGAEPLPEGFRLATLTTPADMRLRLTSAANLTFMELVNVVTQNVADPTLRSAAVTSLLRLLSLPGLLVGSVLMGLAFTAGYRRTNKYGGAVLYGVVLGFVVYVVTELANRSGFAGVLDPTFAAVGPAFVAIVIGLTILLYKEDGRA